MLFLINYTIKYSYFITQCRYSLSTFEDLSRVSWYRIKFWVFQSVYFIIYIFNIKTEIMKQLTLPFGYQLISRLHTLTHALHMFLSYI